MQQKIETRITELQAEYKKGEERLAALEQEIAMVKSSMLRISGALQVLEELIELKEGGDRQEELPGEAN